MNTADKLVELWKVTYPARFVLADKPFAVEIQYLVSPTTSHKSAVDGSFVVFAVTTDGYNLLVDEHSSSDLILQEEFGTVDSLDVTLEDLLCAACVPL